MFIGKPVIANEVKQSIKNMMDCHAHYRSLAMTKDITLLFCIISQNIVCGSIFVITVGRVVKHDKQKKDRT